MLFIWKCCFYSVLWYIQTYKYIYIWLLLKLVACKLFFLVVYSYINIYTYYIYLNIYIDVTVTLRAICCDLKLMRSWIILKKTVHFLFTVLQWLTSLHDAMAGSVIRDEIETYICNIPKPFDLPSIREGIYFLGSLLITTAKDGHDRSMISPAANSSAVHLNEVQLISNSNKSSMMPWSDSGSSLLSTLVEDDPSGGVPVEAPLKPEEIPALHFRITTCSLQLCV